LRVPSCALIALVDVELRHLRALIAVAEELTFTRAAGRLHRHDHAVLMVRVPEDVVASCPGLSAAEARDRLRPARSGRRTGVGGPDQSTHTPRLHRTSALGSLDGRVRHAVRGNDSFFLYNALHE
jgi:hypothetical protein